MQKSRGFFFLIILFCCFVPAQEIWSNQGLNPFCKKYPSHEILSSMVPEKQQKFMNSLAKFALQYKTSSNSVEQFLLRQKRHEFLEGQIKDRLFTEWIGRIKTLRTTKNGKAYLVIELANMPSRAEKKSQIIPEFKVTMSTWNNAYTDLDYNTLILPGSAMHNWLANFRLCEWVVFSGNSYAGEEDFIKEASPTQTEAMLSPQFILKFDYLDKIDFPESEIQLSEIEDKSKIKLKGIVSSSEDKSSAVANNSVISRSKKISKYFIPELTIRFYQEYRLSNYDWDYKSYIDRWHKLVRYHWRNHPPNDYLDGSIPEGGEVFVLATVERDGLASRYHVSSIGEVTENMRESALESTRAVSLPPLPEDFPDEELIAEFRFFHSPIDHLIEPETDNEKLAFLFQDNKTTSASDFKSKMAQKLLKKQLLSEARISFNEMIRREFSSHFQPHHRFEPSLELKFEFSINRGGKVFDQKLTLPGISEKFQLAVLNGLNKARFKPLPKLLRSEAPYRVRLRVIP